MNILINKHINQDGRGAQPFLLIRKQTRYLFSKRLLH